MEKLMKLSEADLQAELEKFSTYFNNEYDSEKVKAAGEDVKTKIVDTYINSSENEELKGSKDEFTKAALENMDVTEAEKQIENGTSTADAELEKLKKPEDERGASMEENSFINANKKLYEDKLNGIISYYDFSKIRMFLIFIKNNLLIYIFLNRKKLIF